MAKLGRKNTGRFKNAGLLAAAAIAAACIITYIWSLDLSSRLTGDFVYPFSALPADIMRSVREEGMSVRSPGELAAAVELLRRDNLLLAAKAKNTAELESEIAVLRTLCDLDPADDFTYTISEVIRRDPVNWYEGFAIDKGALDGVVPGAGVFTVARNNGEPVSVLVGVVQEVSRHQASVRTVLNSEMRFSVRLPEADAVGFINADGQAGSINFLPSDRFYRIGEELVTTGFEEAIPSGLLVGYLETLESRDSTFGNSRVRSGRIKTAADLNTLRYAAVAIRQAASGTSVEAAEE